jgi:hypothetical protein
MAEALRAAHRPVRYVEFAGQGHGLKGLANQQRVWSEVFAFLEPLLAVAHSTTVPSPSSRSSRQHRRLWIGLGSILVALALFGLASRERTN